MPDDTDNLQFGRRQTDSGIIVKLELLHEDVSDMKTVLREMTAAINRLALVEERLSQTSTALERAFTALAKVEARVSSLELSSVNTLRTSSMVDKGVWFVLTAVAAGALTFLGIKK